MALKTTLLKHCKQIKSRILTFYMTRVWMSVLCLILDMLQQMLEFCNLILSMFLREILLLRCQ